jgi:hypothetical protein
MEPRFFTIALLYIPLQIIAVQRAPEIARYARSAKTFALIFQDLLEKAIQSLEMMHYYSVEVEPIAKYGSFIKWVKGLDELRKIIIHYSGPNLPSSFPELVDSIRETAHGFRDLLKSRNVDMIANDPKLEEKEVAELDAAVAERRIKMRAFGIRSGIGTSWSSSEKPESETLRLHLDDNEIEDSRFIANKVIPFLEKLSDGVRNE